jgi:hypothetical protein
VQQKQFPAVFRALYLRQRTSSPSHLPRFPVPAPLRAWQVLVHGTGHHLGSQVAWSLRFRRDGAFYEEIRSKYLTFKWGYDGSPDSTCWEVDPAGVAKHLEYDDHEVGGVGWGEVGGDDWGDGAGI